MLRDCPPDKVVRDDGNIKQNTFLFLLYLSLFQELVHSEGHFGHHEGKFKTSKKFVCFIE